MLSRTHPEFPFLLRFANGLGTLAANTGMHLPALSEKALHRQARRMTGLRDFGSSYYLNGLRRLLESLEKEVDFHLVGRIAMRRTLVRNLCNRLLFREFIRNNPGVLSMNTPPPVLITGLPRTGTTFLHRLLAQDTRFRAIPFWELLRPLPNPRSKTDKRRALTKSDIDRRMKLAPYMDSIHYIRADTPEECMWLMGNTFFSKEFWVLAPVYSYMEWYRKQDRTEPYREYRDMIQVLTSKNRGQPLLLKAPAHLGALKAIVHHIPGIALIQTHRDPVIACSSFNSLLFHIHRLLLNTFDPERTARVSVEYLADEMRRSETFRRKNPGRICNVEYEELVTDPVGVVHSIYSYFGWSWGNVLEQKLRVYVKKNPRRKHGVHKYQTNDFDISEKEIAAFF